MKIPYVNLIKQSRIEKKKLINVFNNILNKSEFVSGFYVEEFEKNIKKYLKTKYCVSLNSGTDALVLGLFALGIRRGDEIITTPNSFIASTAVIVHLGAKPVFVDVANDQNIDPSKIEEKITKKTKAIMPVHLTGRVCNMDKILKIAKKFNLKVIEDAAQAIGSKYKGKFAGTLGDIGCFSAHPLKNLNAIGDGGYLVTKNKRIYEFIKNLRNHGMTQRDKIDNFGFVSRMDNLQAAVLNYRLKNLNNVIEARRKNYEIYKKNLNRNIVSFPDEKLDQYNTYHTFVVQVPKRNLLKKFLKKNGIETSIHYPIPIHLQPAAKKLKYKKGDFLNTETQAKKILTLPINQFLKKKEIIFICKKINSFYI